MSENQDYPSLVDQGKNLAKFSWDLINYIQKNQHKVLFVSDEVYEERINICKGCEKYNDLESRCKECGCFIPAKAKIIIDSCPLNKWKEDKESWEQKFEDITKNLDKPQESH
jgi:hypothetical protein